MRNAILLILSCCFLSVALDSQNISTSFETKRDAKGFPVWYLKGECDLPNSAKLLSRIFFEKQTVPGSSCMVKVQNKKFLCQYAGIRQQIPSGKYVWEISLQDSKKDALVHETSFWFGNPLQERREIAEEAAFYEKMVEDILSFSDVLGRESESQLKSSSDKSQEKIKEWVSNIHKKMSDLEQRFDAWDRNWLFSRFPKHFRDIKNMLSWLDSLVIFHSVEVLQKHQIPLPSQYETMASSPRWDPKEKIPEYHNTIAQFGKRILSQLPSIQNITEETLEKDLLWFNEMFKRLVSQYTSFQQANTEKTSWEKQTELLVQEMQEFRTRLGDYSKSPMATKYTSLVSDLRSMEQCWQSLYWRYIALLAEASGTPVPSEAKNAKAPPEKLIADLQQNFAKVYAIVETKRKEDQDAMEKAWEEAAASLVLLAKLSQDFQQGLSMNKADEFGVWYEGWKKQYEEVSEKIKPLQNRLPEFHHRASLALSWIKVCGKLKEKAMQEKPANNLETSTRIQNLDGQIKLVLQYLQTAVSQKKL